MSFPDRSGEKKSDEAQLATALVQLGELIKQIKESGDNTTKAMLAQQADLIVRQMPENKQCPGIGPYSYPEGELKRPKPQLKCPMHWVGYPLQAKTLTPTEIELLNQLEPGNYTVTKGNGNRIPFNVEGKRNMGGEIESLWISFPCKGDQSTDHASLVSYCQQALGVKIPSREDLMAEIQKLKAELAVA